MFWLIATILFVAKYVESSCLTETGIFETVNSSIKCQECEFQSYLLDNGSCAASSVSFVTASLLDAYLSPYVTTTCELNTQCRNPLGECVPSTVGELCQECSFQGNTVLDENLPDKILCNCYDVTVLNKKNCSRLASPPPAITTQVELVFEKVTCEAFNSTVYGCFKPVNASSHKYGTPHPPIPSECCESYLGPPPGELTEVAFIGENLFGQQIVYYYTCNTVGGIVEQTANFSGFKTCHDHGTFSFENRTCSCDSGFRLAPILGTTGVSSCTECDWFRGPPIGTPGNVSACSQIHTPHVVTGEFMECAGNGVFTTEGECACYEDSVRGYWKLASLTYEGGGVVESCFNCLNSTYSLPSCLNT